MQPDISRVDVRSVSVQDAEAVAHIMDIVWRETQPHSPPPTLAERVRAWQHLNPGYNSTLWLAARDSKLIGYGMARFTTSRGSSEHHLYSMQVGVLPEYRRQGVGSHLIRCLLGNAKEQAKTVLLGVTNDHTAGEAFARFLGAEIGRDDIDLQLDPRDVNHDAVRAWLARAPRATFELGEWDGPYPDERLQEIAQLSEVSGPQGKLHHRRPAFTPEKLRELDQAYFRTNGRRKVIYVQERTTGRLVGWTRVTWHPDNPQLVKQGKTAVLPAYRKQGLAKWLKAAMLQRFLEDRPNVRRVETGVTVSNTPMLKINYEVGFKACRRSTVWQATPQQFEAALQSSN